MTTLPTGWAARIRATVVCSCGDPGSEIPIPDVQMVAVGDGDDGYWSVRTILPCGCRRVLPTQVDGPDVIEDIVVTDPGVDADVEQEHQPHPAATVTAPATCGRAVNAAMTVDEADVATESAPVADQADSARRPDPIGCAHAAHHLTIDQDQPTRVGDHVSNAGIWGTAILCPGCRVGLVLDPDQIQPGRGHDEPTGARGCTEDETRAEGMLDPEDTAAVLQILEAAAPAMDARIRAAETAAAMLRGTSTIGLSSLAGYVCEVLTLAAWILDGTLPGALTDGGETR